MKYLENNLFVKVEYMNWEEENFLPVGIKNQYKFELVVSMGIKMYLFHLKN